MNAILKKIALILAAAALTVELTSCTDDDTDNVRSSQQRIVLEQDDVRTAFEIRANTAWTAECISLNEDGIEGGEPWFMLTPSSGLGTQQVALDVLNSNNTSQSRGGCIVVNYSNGQTHRIEVMQRGLTDIGPCQVTPEQIGLSAAASTDNLFSVCVANRDAYISAVVNTPGATWLKNLEMSYELSYGYSRKEIWKFDVEENPMSDARTAEIGVAIYFGHKTYNYTVTVTQSGLGAPTVKTAPAVYMNCGQTSHRQTIWLEGGSRENVEYALSWTSAYQGTGNTEGWIRNAAVENDELVITADANTDDNAREGSVLIVAHRPGASDEGLFATLSVKVVQSGHKAAGIVLPVAEIARGFAAADYTSQITLLNGSAVKSVTTDNPGMFSPAPAVRDSRLSYTLTEYDGSQGDYREGVITLLVSNGSSNDAVASIKVRQYGPEMPAISAPADALTCDYTQAARQFPLNALNASTLSVVDVSENWLAPVTIDEDILQYTVGEYDGSRGDFREGVITIAAQNAHANKAYYYITVRQYGKKLPEFTLPDYVGAGYQAQDFKLPVTLQDGTLRIVDSPEWAPATFADDVITIAFTENSAASAMNYLREGFVTLAYEKAGATAYYYIHLRQYARDMAYLSATEAAWNWYSLFISSGLHIEYDGYVPAKEAQVVSVMNVPSGEIETGCSNEMFTVSRTGMDISVEPSTWEILDRQNPTSTLEATVTVYITGFPYHQTLTLPVSAVQENRTAN